MKILYTILFCIFFAETQDISAYDIIKRMDSREKINDVKTSFIMTTINEKGKKRESEFISWSKDAGRKQMMWFLKPIEYKGMSFLKIQTDDKSSMTMWSPRYKKLRKISSQNKGNSFMGSELTFEDLYTRNIESFTYNLLKEESFNNIACYVIESVPDGQINSNYSKHITWISKDNLLPLKEISYNNANQAYKSKVFTYENDNKINLIRLQNLKKESYTTLEIKSLDTDVIIDDNSFQRNSLKRIPK